MALWLRIIASFGASILYLMLAVLGVGGFAAFLAQPAFIALAGVTFIAAGVALRAGGNLSAGVREERGNRWVLVPFERLNVWTIDGGSIRWLGVALYAVGCWLRILPVFILGNRFSGLVAIQKDHALEISGLYARIRNPSYLGLLISLTGWSLAFRSGIGLLLTALLVPPLIARMNAEEKLLHEQFGPDYDAYRAHSWRLIPGIY